MIIEKGKIRLTELRQLKRKKREQQQQMLEKGKIARMLHVFDVLS